MGRRGGLRKLATTPRRTDVSRSMDTKPPRVTYDCIVVGAGPAGLSAALMLGRCCRHVLVCDMGEPRNARSSGIHAYLTRDGVSPGELLELARREIQRYPNVEF